MELQRDWLHTYLQLCKAIIARYKIGKQSLPLVMAKSYNWVEWDKKTMETLRFQNPSKSANPKTVEIKYLEEYIFKEAG